MDLTSLSSTLPSQSRNARESQYDYPPAALMSAFKQAAMSVTTLYKSANTEIERARNQGYQDALDDLLQLINSDRIHANSEVAKIREWGLSKRRKNGGEAEGGAHGDSIYESEDERGQSRAAGSSSPMRESEPLVRSPPQPQPQPQPTQPEPVSSPAYSPPSPPEPREKSSSFTFRSNHHYPRHPPPPPRAPMLEDIELPDTTPGSPVSTPLGEQSLHHINPNIPPVSQRATSGAWKRRFPFDFLELAAMAEKEKQAYAGMDFPNNKRGRMT